MTVPIPKSKMDEAPEHQERNLRQRYRFLPKDYVRTADGACWAVLAPGVEQGRVLAWLRHVRRGDARRGDARRGDVWHGGTLQKLASIAAGEYVAQHCPDWNFVSQTLDATVHGIPVEAVQQHVTPASFFDPGAFGQLSGARRTVCDSLRSLFGTEIAGLSSERPRVMPTSCEAVAPEQIGVTGSALLGVEHDDSDIDLVVYGRRNMQLCRKQIRLRIQAGQLQPLSSEQWRLTYERRGCELSFDEYVWHEQRKLNKCMFDGVRVDLSCVDAPHAAAVATGRKLGQVELTAVVTDATHAFASPAVYGIECDDEKYRIVTTLIASTATYVGQAVAGERVHFAGRLEQCANFQRVVVGSSREACGEFIRVVR